MKTVYASFLTGNDASKRVMGKCGMTFSRFSKREVEYLGVERDMPCYAVGRKEIKRLFSGVLSKRG